MPLPLLPEQASIEASFEEQLSQELGSIDFADALPGNATPEQMDKAAPALIRYLLSSGSDGGFKDGIDVIQDEDGNPPSQENNWLFDADEDAFKGQFIDRRPEGDRIFQFTIERDGDEWMRSFSVVSGIE